MTKPLRFFMIAFGTRAWIGTLSGAVASLNFIGVF